MLTLQFLKQTDRCLWEKNEKVIGSMKDEVRGQIMKEFVQLRAKSYSYLKDNNGEDKKTKGTKKCAIKKELKFKDYNNCLRASQIENILNFLEKKKLMYIVLKKNFLKMGKYQKHTKDLKGKDKMFSLKKLTRLL